MLQLLWESIQCLFSFEKGQKGCPEACLEGVLAQLSAGAVGLGRGTRLRICWSVFMVNNRFSGSVHSSPCCAVKDAVTFLPSLPISLRVSGAERLGMHPNGGGGGGRTSGPHLIEAAGACAAGAKF